MVIIHFIFYEQLLWLTLNFVFVESVPDLLLHLYVKLCIMSTSYLPSWMTACRSGPWRLLEAQKYPSHWREEALKEEVGLKPPHPCKITNSYNSETYSAWLFTGRFGQTTPPLVEFLKDILRRYPEGGQILKVSAIISHFTKTLHTSSIICVDDAWYNSLKQEKQHHFNLFPQSKALVNNTDVMGFAVRKYVQLAQKQRA